MDPSNTIKLLLKRSLLVPLAVSLLIAAVGAGGAAASPDGVSPAQLSNADWTCLYVLGAVHCAPPGGLERVVAGTAETMSFLVFGTSDPAATEAPFLGTEVIIRDDVFHGQPCPTDPPSGQYTHLLPLMGLDYWACHRYDSGF